ncbi:hypothetical protein ACDA63_07135 [Uliginosibacterium sp. sgz301328]|uniref:hypothetical protein n=1 Tax=Uliginosibacterium sp. sgz301328 TaxID=3243764 RepID=UPI00359F0D3C
MVILMKSVVAAALLVASMSAWSADTEFFVWLNGVDFPDGYVVQSDRQPVFIFYTKKKCDLPLVDASKYRKFEMPLALRTQPASGRGCWFHAYPDKIVFIYESGSQDVRSDISVFRVKSKDETFPATVVGVMNPLTAQLREKQQKEKAPRPMVLRSFEDAYGGPDDPGIQPDKISFPYDVFVEPNGDKKYRDGDTLKRQDVKKVYSMYIPCPLEFENSESYRRFSDASTNSDGCWAPLTDGRIFIVLRDGKGFTAGTYSGLKIRISSESADPVVVGPMGESSHYLIP